MIPAFTIDPSMPDDPFISWETGIYECDCGFTFAYVIRMDRPLACPQCDPDREFERLDEAAS